MAGGIRVTPEQLQALAGQVHRNASEIDAQLGVLRQTLAPLGTDWAGQAQLRFQSLVADWQTAANRLQQALDGIAGLMTQAGQAYASAEQQIAATFQA